MVLHYSIPVHIEIHNNNEKYKKNFHGVIKVEKLKVRVLSSHKFLARLIVRQSEVYLSSETKDELR